MLSDLVGAIIAHGDTVGIGAMLAVTLAIVFRQLATGRLVFRSQLEELRVDKDAEMARVIIYYDKLVEIKDQQAKSWETAYTNESVARRDQGVTLAELAELARAADHMLRALPTSQGATSRASRRIESE